MNTYDILVKLTVTAPDATIAQQVMQEPLMHALGWTSRDVTLTKYTIVDTERISTNGA